MSRPPAPAATAAPEGPTIAPSDAPTPADLARLRTVPAPDAPLPPPPAGAPGAHEPPSSPSPVGRTLRRLLGELAALLDELHGLDLDHASDAATVEALVQLPRLAGRLAAAKVGVARSAERRSVAPRHELLSTEQALRAIGGHTRSDARFLLTCGDVLTDMPGCQHLFAAGQLTWGVVRFLVAEARRLPIAARRELDDLVAGDLVAVQQLDGDELVAAIGWALVELAPERADDRAERAVEREYATLMPRLDGGGAIYAEYEAVGFATVANAMETAARRVASESQDVDGADAQDPTVRTRRDSGRRAAGLVDIARTYLGGGPGRPAKPLLLLVAESADARRTGHAPPAESGLADHAVNGHARGPNTHAMTADRPDRARPLQSYLVDVPVRARPAPPALLIPFSSGQPVARSPRQTDDLLRDAEIRSIPGVDGVPTADRRRRDRWVRSVLRDQVVARDGGCRSASPTTTGSRTGSAGGSDSATMARRSSTTAASA